MSHERNSRLEFERGEYDQRQARAKGSYTEEGFYRKSSNHPAIHLSNLSQKQSLYDQRLGQCIPQTTSEFGYSTLNPASHPPAHPREEEYEIIVEFELKREREKNRILEERLKNKEIFISQMKDVQNQLTLAFQKCQEQLEFYKKKSSQPSIETREYLEQINELKHLVIRLEDKITEYEKRENRRYSSVKQQQAEEHRKSISKFQQEDTGRGSKVREKRAKTLMNQHDSSPEFKKFDVIEEYVVKYPGRITSFISQFLAMVQWFSGEAQQAKQGEDRANVKRRLKISWKWIKETVAEWSALKAYTDKLQPFLKRVRKLCGVSEETQDFECWQLILQSLRK